MHLYRSPKPWNPIAKSFTTARSCTVIVGRRVALVVERYGGQWESGTISQLYTYGMKILLDCMSSMFAKFGVGELS